MNDRAGYVVVDIWRAKPGAQAEVDAVLAASGPRFRAVEGILSVDYTRLEEEDNRYLVVFRYANREAREAFSNTEDLRSTMATLEQFWDLVSPVYRGVDTGF